MSQTLLRSFSASPWFKFALEITVSVEVIISTIGNLTGVTTKFNPFARRETSLSDSFQSERFFTHLFFIFRCYNLSIQSLPIEWNWAADS